jgi:hypothetical protein
MLTLLEKLRMNGSGFGDGVSHLDAFLSANIPNE